MALASGPRSGQLWALFNQRDRKEKALKGRNLHKDDNAVIAAADLPAALGLLTRLPVPVDTARATERGAAAAWAYPLVGAIIGAILAAFAGLFLWLGVPSGIAAALVLAVGVTITGAMHEDGLADTADGLWGGWEPAHRLAIMKDSHIGVYGTCAIALSLLLRWLALVAVVSFGGYWTALIAIGALSRAAMVFMMAALPNARDGGLSRSVGRPSHQTTWVAIGAAALIALICGYLWLIAVVIPATLICAAIAKAKIGGQTGDILGATQQVCEIALLIALVSGLG